VRGSRMQPSRSGNRARLWSGTGTETMRRHASVPVSGPVTGRTDARPTHRTPFAHGDSALSERHWH
jgi:hypothetical protein